MADKAVDNLIVEMQFDGKDFDKNIRKSQKNLEDFKKSLNFEDAAKQMETLSDGGEFGSMFQNLTKNVQKLAKEFTGIGTIGSFVAQKLKHAWQDAANSVLAFTKSMTSDQITEGSKKYDGLLKSVQTIKNATGDAEETVYSVMEKLNKYTDETSYNFADMANNIGKFTTAGVNLTDAETEMEGIANWAALAGQGVQEAQRAMYNISQAMSAGSMRLVDYKSIQNANMDIRKFRQEALDAAVAAGTLKKAKDGVYKTVKGNKVVNLDNFTETLQYKWFDRATMEAVFKVFADNTKGIGLEAYKAAQRCITLNDAINAWKDMLSTGWMKSYEHVFGQLTDAMNLFSGLCNKVSESLSAFVELRNGILERWSISGGRDSLWGALLGELETPDGETLFKGAYGLLDAMQDIGNSIYDAFWDFVGRFIDPNNKALFEADREGYGMSFLAAGLTTLTQKFQEFTNKIEDFLFKADPGETETRFDRLRHVAEAIYAAITLVVDVVRGIGQFAGEIIKQLYPAIHAIELLIDGLLQMFTGDVAQSVKQNTIGNFFHRLAEILRPVTMVINIVVQALASLIARIVVMAKQSGFFNMLGSALQGLMGLISTGIAKVINSGVLQTVFGWIQTGISKIPSLVQKIKMLASTLAATAKNSKFFSKIGSAFKSLFGGKNVKTILSNLKDGIVNLVKKIPSILPTIAGSLSGVWEKISSFFANLFGNIFGAGTASAEGSESVTEKLSEAIAKPIEELGKGNVIGDAIDKAKPGFLSNLKTKLQELWGNISEFFSNIGNSEAVKKIKSFFSGTTLMNLLGSAKDIMKWLAIFRTGSGLVSIGKGFKSFGKGIKVFGKNLKNLNLSNIFSNMFNISNIINSNNTDNSKRIDFGKLGDQLLKIAGAIALVAGAAYVLAKLKPDELKQAGISLGVIVTTLLGASWLSKKIGGSASGFISLAAALLVIMIPLKIVKGMDWGALLDGVAKLSLIMFSLALAGRIAGNAKMKGFIGFAIALELLLLPLKALMNMPIGSLSKGGGLIQGIIALEALMFSMALAARIAEGNKLKGMLTFAIAINLLIIPVKAIAGMKWNEALQGVGYIVALIMAIAGMIKITDGAEVGKLAGIVGALTALSAIGWLVGHTMDWKQALIGFGPIILLIGMMTLLFKQAAKMDANQLNAVKKIFNSLSIAIVAIAAAITIMSQLGVGMDIALVFFGGLVLMLGVMSYMLKQASKMNEKSLNNTAKIFAAMSLLVAVAGGALIAMSKLGVDWTLVAAFTVGLSVLIAALGWAIPKLANISVLGAVKGIAILAIAVVAIMGAISLMIPVVLGSVGSAMESLAARLKTMSGLLKDFFDRMGSISDGAMQHAITVFDNLKTMLLRFAGFGIFESDIKAVMNQLNYLGTGLDLFFVNDSKYPDPENSMSFKVLNKFIEIGPSLAAFNVGSMPEQMMYMGVGIALFNEATKNIKTTNPPALGLLEGIFGQADNIKKFSELPLDNFRSQMSGLGGAMSLYAKGAKEVTGIDADEDAPDVTKAIGILKAVCDSLSGEDGSGEFKIPENMPDSTKLGLFAGQLEALGTALSSFATAAKSMETDTSKALKLLEFLAYVGGYITPESLGVVNAFDDAGLGGEGSEGGKLGQFALDIGALGTALSSFATNIGGNEGEFNTGLSILERFGDLNSLLTKDNLKFAKVFDNAGVHETSLTQFSTDIGALGRALASFAQNVTLDDGTQADFDYALKSLDFLAHLQIKLSAIKLDGIAQWFEGNSATLGTLANDIQQLGQALSDFSDKITGATEGAKAFDADTVLATMDVLGKMIGILNAINIGHSGEWGGVTDKAFELVNFFSILFDETEGASRFVDGSFIQAFAKFAQDLTSVFNNTEGIDAAAIDVFQKLADGLSSLITLDTSNTFEYPGEMITEGLARGIEKGRSRVVNAIVAIVQAAIDAGKATAVIDSPSKVFTEMGEFMDAGLVKGLKGSQDNVENASSDMTKSAIESASNVMALISQAMAEDIDIQPTITPVLDLSSITEAGSTLDRIFSGYALNFGSALDRAVAATAGSGAAEVIVQNPTDLSGVQSSIAGLQTEIVNLQGAISKMQIVLNTGVIAGGVTDDVDRNLGTKNLYARRRN